MPKSKRISLTDMRIAIAKECLIYEDYSKETVSPFPTPILLSALANLTVLL